MANKVNDAVRRQMVRFAFYHLDPAWQRLDSQQREEDKRELLDTVTGFGGRMLLRGYSLVGLRADVDFLLWQVTEDLAVLRAFATALNQTRLGSYLTPRYAFLSMTRRSIYHIPDMSGDDGDRLTIQPGQAKYLFVYPFVKTRAWYALPKVERQRMMEEHIRVGRTYPSVKLNTTYSYGLDDQEFVVAFETDDAADFLDLVAELRETEASTYTLRDTPMFTCEALGLPAILDSLAATPGGMSRPTPAPQPSTSDGWRRVARLADLPPGASTLVYVDNEAIALWRVGDQIFAVNNRCSHARGPLCDGALDGTTLTCPWHGARYDLRTGAVLSGPARAPVATYRVRLASDGGIDVSTQPAGGDKPDAAADDHGLDAVDRKLLNLLQWEFPLVERPFAALAERASAELGGEIGEDDVMRRVEHLRQRTIIRQLSAIFDTRKIGYQSSLVAARVAPEHLGEAAAIINQHPGVSHNYRRDNHFNLWFTLAVPPEDDLDDVLAALTRRAGVEIVRKLPNLRMYKIAVKLDMERDEREITRQDEAPRYAKNPRRLTARDRAIVRAVQSDLPTTARFFDAAAAQAGLTVPELFAWMSEMMSYGYLRRFAAILRHQEAGFTANGMITWRVPEDRVDEVGYKAAAYPQVSHCYRRPVYPDWPYNVFSMVHARSRESCEEIAGRMAADLGVSDYIILYSTHEYKKTRVESFGDAGEGWSVAGGEGAAWADLDRRIAAGELASAPGTTVA